jgi:hypothetical protein
MTTSPAVVLLTAVPLIPERVRETVPGGVLALVATVRMELPDPVNVAGVNFAVAPGGRFVASRPTAPAKPFTADTVTV